MMSRARTSARIGLIFGKLKQGNVATFYFAGHGVEFGGRNYLLPRDIPPIRPGREELIRREGSSIQEFLLDLRETNRLRHPYLDACRDNPFETAFGRSVGASRGLASAEPPEGTFILYSAGAGESALDRLDDQDRDPNSVYTRQLLPLLKRPGLSLTEVAEQVRIDVRATAKTVNHQQTPAYYNQIVGRMCLAGGDCSGRAVASIPSAPSTLQPGDIARQDWEYVQKTKSLSVLQGYWERHKTDPIYGPLAETEDRRVVHRDPGRQGHSACRIRVYQWQVRGGRDPPSITLRKTLAGVK